MRRDVPAFTCSQCGFECQNSQHVDSHTECIGANRGAHTLPDCIANPFARRYVDDAVCRRCGRVDVPARDRITVHRAGPEHWICRGCAER